MQNNLGSSSTGSASMTSTSSSAASLPKSRRELFEETARPPAQRYTIQQCSLRGDDDAPVASTSKSAAGLRLKDGCYATLEQFRANDTGRQTRLRKLYNTLKEEWAVPHTHHDEEQRQRPAGSTSKTLPSAYPTPHNAEERKVADVRKEYLRELYHSLCPGEGGKGKEPTLEVFTDFVEQKEEALWRVFCEIDKDNDMQLHPEELHAALSRSDISISLDKLQDMVKEMDKTGSGKVTFEEWRDFLLLLPRPASLGNIFTYWKSHSKQPRLASSIANQDLDVILAELPAPQASTSSLPAGAASSAQAPGSSSSQAKGKGRELHAEGGDSPESDEEAVSDADKPIFEGSLAYLLAGGLAGAVSRTATAPFDRLKVYLINHVDRSGAKLPSVSKTAVHPIEAAQDIAKTGNKGVGIFANAIRDLYSQGGVKAFFVGNGLNVIKIFPESAVKFWSYEYSKRWFARNVDHCHVADISGSSRFIAGGLGGVTSQLLIYPLETWKTRVMSSTSTSGLKGNALYLATAKNMAKTGGVRAYYSGLSMGLIGVFPYSAIDMSLFAAFKKAYMKYTGDDEPGPAGSLTFGALSGGLGATSVYPLNLLRTRMQTQGTPAHPQKYTGWRDVATKCYRNEGLKGFYKGLSPTLLKVSPSMGISWLVYEYSTSLFFPQHDNGNGDSNNDTKEE